MGTMLDSINNGAAAAGVDPNLLIAVGGAETGLQTGKTSSTGVRGVFQITGSTWASLRPGVPYSTDVYEQAYTAALLIKQNQEKGFNSPELAYTAYNAGPQIAGLVQKSINNGSDFPAAVSQAMSSAYPSGFTPYKKADGTYITAAEKASEIVNGTNRTLKGLKTGNQYTVAGSSSNASSSASPPAQTVTNSQDPLDAIPLIADPVTQSKLQETKMNLVIPEGLDNTPWFDDPNLVVGNPHLKQVPSPITFSINLRELGSNFLPNKKGSSDPLILRLNTSLEKFSIQMKHVINKSNTRTGFHLTFWGMEPDSIQGSGTTGVFMNQFGLTGLMSLCNDGELLEKAQALFNNDEAFNTLANFSGDTNTFPLRVAAQDAFVELLSLFKNNGLTRFKSDNYDGLFSNRTQMDKSVWSAEYGDSTYGRTARNNDVMVKGSVVMTYKSNVYHGYFKSFNWTMDADHPFQWKFDFVFQVQKTLNFAFYPK